MDGCFFKDLFFQVTINKSKSLQSYSTQICLFALSLHITLHIKFLNYLGIMIIMWIYNAHKSTRCSRRGQ